MKKATLITIATLVFLTTSFCLFSCANGASGRHEHDYTAEVVSSHYLKSDATCASKAVYFKSCSCGEKGTETFEHGEVDAAKHTGGTRTEYVYIDATSHQEKSVCEDCYMALSIETEAHSGGATESCPKCGGKAHNHNYNEETGECTVCGFKKVAGLYDPSTGALTYTWDELISEGFLFANGAVVREQRPNLIGELVLPATLTAIRDGMFHSCTGLTSVVIPAGVTEIGISAFRHCTNLTSIDIPNSVKAIRWFAFDGCSKLTSITIGRGVDRLDDRAFADCTSLTEINIPGSVKTVGYTSFMGCTSLKKVTIDEGTKEIETCAFSACTNLKEIYIPKSVTVIGDFAFSHCEELTDIYFGGTVASWKTLKYEFAVDQTNIVIHCTDGDIRI